MNFTPDKQTPFTENKSLEKWTRKVLRSRANEKKTVGNSSCSPVHFNDDPHTTQLLHGFKVPPSCTVVGRFTCLKKNPQYDSDDDPHITQHLQGLQHAAELHRSWEIYLFKNK